MPIRTRLTSRLAFLAVQLTIILLLSTSSSRGAVIEPTLKSRMSAASDDSLLSVVIRPLGALDPAHLKADVQSQWSTRTDQHREVIAKLIKAASESQNLALDALKSPQFAAGVEDARGYWIDNVITARMSKSAITAMADRADIESIELMPDVTLVTPLSAGSAGDEEQQVTQNQIKAIKADSVWLAGYTGKGRLVGSLDTGVDGKHVSLTNNWRGHNGGTLAASWHDPVYGDTVPRVYTGAGLAHGTQVMGLMVGIIPALNDSIGVCPDCDWISAAAIDVPCPTNNNAPCGNLFDALQWIADPDADPNTDWDAPDAVANPWGAITRSRYDGCSPTGFGCSDLFWNAIDNVEAAGTLMIFAAGNEGDCGAMSIRNPANRIASETNSFSVGMVDARTNVTNPPVDLLSSRGPSDCDGSSIKPELVAPGVNLRSTTPNNGISGSAYGTSFATPMVAAGAALLREYNPNATVDQIKSALLAGARDLGPVGPDNSYGHGLLDLMEALRQLPPNTSPAISIVRDVYDPPAPGTSAEITFTLRNCGTSATGVEVTLSSPDPRLTIIDGHSSFADMTVYGDSANNLSDPFEISVHALCIPGERLPMVIEIQADGAYSRTIGGALVVGPENELSLFTHDAGNFRMTIGADGTFGHQPDGIAPRPGGIGYLTDGDPTQTLFDGAFMIGAGPNQVSDDARDETGLADVDLRVSQGGRISISEPGQLLAEETRSAFDDSYAPNPIGLFVEQRTMASDLPGHGDYLIVEYTIHNRSGQILDNLHCGLFFDWDFPYTSFNVATRDGGGFDAASGVGWMRHRDEGRLRGICILSETPLSGYRFFTNLTEIYDGFSESEKWNAMTGGTSHALPFQDGDGSHAIGAGPFALGFEESTRVAFAVIGATSVPQLLESAQLARLQYAATTSPLAIDILPGACPNELSTWGSNIIELPGMPKVKPTAGVDVAILGEGDFDISSINPFTVRLAGLSPIGSKIEDVSIPVPVRESGVCECNRGGADGHPDLVLTFDQNDVQGLMAADELSHPLALTAQTTDKVLMLGSDCLRLVSGPMAPPVITARPPKTRLGFNSPNPFNASTQIEVTLETGVEVSLEVYDVLGRRVRALANGRLDAGRHEFTWDGRSDGGMTVASGTYFARLSSNGDVQVSKMVLLK